MSRARFALLCVAILLGAVGLAEGLTRLRAHWRHGPHLDLYALFETDPASGLLRPPPHLDATFGGAHLTTDSHGFRSPELAQPKSAGSLRLAFLGGSTTFCANVAEGERSWPALTTARLAQALPGTRVEHLNAGVTGWGVAESTRALAAHVAPLQPDVIVITHATNDMARDSEALARQQGVIDPATDGEPDALERWSLLWMLIRKNQRYQAAQRAGREGTARLETPAAEWSQGFEQRLTELVRAAQALAPLVALVTFAHAVRAEQPRDVQLLRLAQSFTFMPYLTPEATLAAYAEYNRVIARVAHATGALLVDGELAIPGDEAHFADSVHFTELGCEAMAARVADALLASPRLRTLVGAASPAAGDASPRLAVVRRGLDWRRAGSGAQWPDALVATALFDERGGLRPRVDGGAQAGGLVRTARELVVQLMPAARAPPRRPRR